MTDQPPPYPKAPPTARGELLPSRGADVAAAWILWGLLLVVCLILSLLMLLIGLGFGFQCADASTSDGQICGGPTAEVAQGGVVLTALVMVFSVLGTLAGTIVAVRRRRLAWVWPAGGFGAVVLAFAIWKVVYESVS